MKRARPGFAISLPSVPSVIRAGAPAWLALIAVTSFAPWPRTPFAFRPSVLDTSPAFRYPTGIAVDTSGAVYVASAGDSSVVVFAPGARGRVAPVRRIGGPGTGLGAPRGIALDSRGRLFVSLSRHEIAGKGSITAYASTADGDAAPIRTIVGPATKLETPAAIGLGKRGRIYVANGTGNLNLGPNTSTFLGANPSDKAVLAFDAADDGNVAPRQSLPDTRGSSRPVDIAVDTAGNLVTVNGADVTVWGDLGPQRRIFVSKEKSGGSAFVSPGSAFLNDVPGAPFLNDVEGGAETVLPPSRVAVGPKGTLYVAPRMAPPNPKAKPTPTSPLRMFETLRAQKAIAIYRHAESSDTVPQRIVGGSLADFSDVRDMAVRRDGALYVLTGNPGSSRPESRILVFSADAEGDVPPARVIAGPGTGLSNAVAIALDRAGSVYALNNLGGTDPLVNAASITVYAPDATGDAAPMRTIAGHRTRLLAPTALAVADDGTVYVANAGTWNDDNGSVRVYAADAAGAAPPLRILIGNETRLIAPTGLALGRRDTLYVLGSTRFVFGKTRISVFAPNADRGAVPVRTLEGDSTGFSEPTAIAVDDDGRLYSTNKKAAGGINAYGPDLGSVTVYSEGARGNRAPTRTIEGSYTRLNGPSGLARDRSGNAYVANRWGTGPGSVTVYSPQAEEDVRPIRMISGPATGLQSPAGLALDAHDTLYVLNERSVTVYAPGALGDAPPVRTIGGP